MKREGNKLSIFKIEKIPIFSHDAPKFGFGDGRKCEKNGEKSIWKYLLRTCLKLVRVSVRVV